MPPLIQGPFTIDSTGSSVMIGEGHSSANQIVITITNTGNAPAKVRVIVKVKTGNAPEALLESDAVTVFATYANATGNTTGTLSPAKSSSESRSKDVKPPAEIAWQTSTGGVAVNPGKQLSIKLAGFDSNTPTGNAPVDVLVQMTYKDGVWSPKQTDVSEADRTIKIAKVAAAQTESKIHYFAMNPDYILHAGETPVAVSFYATGFDSLALFRNNQEVQNWPSNDDKKTDDGSITGTYSDRPSITTVYRLEGKPNSENATKPGIEKIRYQTVQVISPGWNQIALPQGYPARLFAHTDFKRLYGIFIGAGKAALYSSATGVDDWRLEPGDVPQEMAMSPGVAYKDKLWLIGGSCVDPDNPGSEVWSYKIDNASNEGTWTREPDFPMTARMGHACVVFPRSQGATNTVEEIWVLGGYNNGTYFNDVWKFYNGGWEEIKLAPSSPKWTARLMHAAVSFRPPAPQGEKAPPAEVYIYGGADVPSPERGLQDLWSTSEGTIWKELKTQQDRGIIPRPGPPLAAALVSAGGAGSGTAARLFLGGTFLEAENSNRIASLIFESKRLNRTWLESPVIDGWEQFEGGFFYLQAVSFNGFLFVWTLLNNIPTALPKLNILIPR